MKLMAVGHSYVLAFAQSKYAAMKRLDPSLQLRIVIPRETRHTFGTYTPEQHHELDRGDVISLRAFLNGSHMTQTFLPGALADAMRSFNPDHIHIEEDPHSFSGAETVFLSRRVSPKATVSFFIWDNLARVPTFPVSFVKRQLNGYSQRRADLFVCGNREAQQLLRESKGYPGPSVVLPQMGLDPEDFNPNTTVDLPVEFERHAIPVIAFFGRLVPEKGVRVLLEALLSIQHMAWRVVFVGDGPLRDEIATQWKERLRGRLSYLPPVSHRQVAQYLRGTDIFVLPSYGTSTWKEQFGLALAQAMMAGVACVGSSSGAIPEVLNSHGVIFRERDATDLARALSILLESPALRHELGQSARQHALRHYTNTAVASAYLDVFRSLHRAAAA